MALGEYVSVSSQSDSERALIAKETEELRTMPEQELEELAGLYRAQGLSDETAKRVAVELTERDALRAHLSMELNIDPDDLVSPWRAAAASASLRPEASRRMSARTASAFEVERYSSFTFASAPAPTTSSLAMPSRRAIIGLVRFTPYTRSSGARRCVRNRMPLRTSTSSSVMRKVWKRHEV